MSLTYNNVLNINKKNYNGVTIEERALSGKINIRGKSSDKEFMKNIGKVLNLVLPIEPNVRIFNNNISIIWLGPNEWLVETPENEKDEGFGVVVENSPKDAAPSWVSEERSEEQQQQLDLPVLGRSPAQGNHIIRSDPLTLSHSD